MKDFALVENEQTFLIDNFGLTFTTTNDQFVAQKLRRGLKIVLGEWYLNINLGLPYIPKDGDVQPTPTTMAAAMKAYILSVDGVESIDRFDFSFDAHQRKFSVDFQVKLTDGTTASGAL